MFKIVTLKRIFNRLSYLKKKATFFLYRCKLRICFLIRKKFHPNKSSNLIISLTSYPKRINNVWLTIESLFQQKYTPWKIVLVLCEAEFPNKVLPKKIEAQISRGLEIIWVKDNIKSYKKLIPTKKKFPSANIITFDDDLIYENWRVSKLVIYANNNKNCIVGFRGREICFSNGKLEPYKNWKFAVGRNALSKIVLTGAGGIYYPVNSLNKDILYDIKCALTLAPTADDLWFWLAALSNDTPVYCIGYNQLIHITTESRKSSLHLINSQGGQNNIQLEAIIKRFHLEFS